MKPRDWPNNALGARDESIIQATVGVRALLPLLNERYTQEEIYRRIGIAIDAFHTIKTLLIETQQLKNERKPNDEHPSIRPD